MKHRLFCACLLLAALVPMTNCSDATLVAIAGELKVEFTFTSATPSAIDTTVSCSMIGTAPPGAGNTTIQDGPTRNFDGSNPSTTYVDTHVGTWRCTVNATHVLTGKRVLNNAACSSVTISSSTTTTIAFVEDSTLCTCPSGGCTP